ncbi:hypothetical protein ZIOFF_001374 [Zingiber officinale]|uniref:Protein ENHANCED DISEASE RESISTANCE 2 C-terminal domain-containing protein n=1 Tax=Zingiber officinale TaxID=94328 RepID=A0A8J5I9Q7_ZINOF|nr:hypothetical protein ZIOFF_001374 [Zingiber officinale]
METIDEALGFEGDDPMAFSNPAFQGDGLIRFFERLRIDGVCLGKKMGFSMGLIKITVSFGVALFMTTAGSVEETWFDTFSVIDSDEEDFKSIPDDILSLNGIEGEAIVSPKAFRDDNLGVTGPDNLCIISMDQQKGQRTGEQSLMNSVSNPKSFVSHEDLSVISMQENDCGEEESVLNNCGILPNNCLPCLVVATSTVEKRKAIGSSPPNSAKKASLKLSFKRKSGEAHATSTQFSTKAMIEKPLAGSQVQFCALEKKMLDSWSPIEPNTFRVRGEHYLRDKKKDLASNCAVYSPFGVDVYFRQQKINHIARYVQLPIVNSLGKLPPLLVVNVQVPLYPATIFQSETDGEGISFVLYFRLSEGSKELPSHFLENVQRLIDDEVERCRGFPMDSVVPFRDRLKILGRVANVEDLPLSTAERKLMHAYNEKPVLSRPQHEFYLGKNYFEIDIDMHRFSYIARKGFETFIDRLKICILDVGLTIQFKSSNGGGDLLKKYGLPKGILPHAKHHSLSDDGDLTVELKAPCYIQFSDLVYYDRSVAGALSYGVLSDLSGVQVKKLFVWLPVSAIEARPDSGTVDFKVPFLTLSYSADEFQKIRDCLDSAEESEFLPFSECTAVLLVLLLLVCVSAGVCCIVFIVGVYC